MDIMVSYCGHDSDHSSQEIEDSLEYFIDKSKIGELDYTNDHYSHSQFAFEQDLRKNNERLEAIIKRQEKEISSYRNHIETIEDDYSKVSSSLVAAEKEIKQHKEKIYSYECTIGSLRSELDSFYNLERSTKDVSSTSECCSLSLNLPLRTASNKETENSASNFSDGIIKQTENQAFEKFLICFKEMCEQNNELKAMNELLKKENSLLMKDNEDFQNLLWNSKDDFSRNSSKKFKVSTPIKNFISYQSLNINNKNNSFSIDDDYEFENITCENDIFSKRIVKTLDFSAIPSENTFSISRMSSSRWIENEEMPSKMNQVKEDPTNSNFGQISNSLFSESVKKTINEISSIENEKMPQVEMTESTITQSTVSCAVGSIDLPTKPSLCIDHLPANNTTPQDPSVTYQSKLWTYFQTILLTTMLTTLICTFKLRSVAWFARKLFYPISLYVFLILISKQNVSHLDINTTITPFYSFQEILLDLLCQ